MKKVLIFGAMATMPIFAFAQTIVNQKGNLTNFVVYMGKIINVLVPLTSTLAVVYFFYGLATFILSAGDEDKAKKGKGIMIWGVVAMFIIVTIFGIIGFMQQTIGNTIGPRQQVIETPNVIPSGVIGGTPY